MKELLNEFENFLVHYDPNCSDDDFEQFCLQMETSWFHLCSSYPKFDKNDFFDSLINKGIHQDVISELLAIDRDYISSQSANCTDKTSDSQCIESTIQNQGTNTMDGTNASKSNNPLSVEELLGLPKGWDIDNLLVPEEYMDSSMVSLRLEIDNLINICSKKLHRIEIEAKNIQDLEIAQQALVTQTTALNEEETEIMKRYNTLKKEAFKYKQLLSTDPFISVLWPQLKTGGDYSTNVLEKYLNEMIIRNSNASHRQAWKNMPLVQIDPLEELSDTTYILKEISEPIYQHLKTDAEEWLYDSFDMLTFQSKIAMGKLCSRLIINARIAEESTKKNQAEWHFMENCEQIFTISFYGIPSSFYYTMKLFDTTIETQSRSNKDLFISSSYLSQAFKDNREFPKVCLFFGCVLCAIVLGFFSNFSPEIDVGKCLSEHRPNVSKKMKLYAFINALFDLFKQSEKTEMERIYKLFNRIWNIEEYIGVLKHEKYMSGFDRFINRN